MLCPSALRDTHIVIDGSKTVAIDPKAAQWTTICAASTRLLALSIRREAVTKNSDFGVAGAALGSKTIQLQARFSF